MGRKKVVVVVEVEVNFSERKFSRVVWKEDKVGKYTVKSAYLLLRKATCRSVKDFNTLVWHNLVPLKVAAFAWWLLTLFIPKSTLLTKGHRKG